MEENLQYDWTQMQELETARQEGLDTSLMEDVRYLAEQMKEIRLGLEAGIDVSLYAKPEFDWFQMEQIRMGLEERVDVSLYAFADYPYDVMKQVRLAWHSYVDLSPYLQSDFEGKELEEIRIAMEGNLPIHKWIREDMYAQQIHEIRLGLEQDLDVSLFAGMEFDWRQMQEIRLGLEKRIDVSVYAKPLMGYKQMREIRLGLEEGLDVAAYASLSHTRREMEQLRLSLLKEQKTAGKRGKATSISQRHMTSQLEIDLIIEEYGLKAYFYIKGGKNNTVSTAELLQELSKKGISYGILENQISQIAEKQLFEEKILVAEGKAPVQGKDGWYEFFVRIDIPRIPDPLPDGSVDYLGIDAFEFVEEGQEIARYHPAVPGTNGRDVFGNEIQALKGAEKAALRGNSIKMAEDRKTYIARKSGKFEYRDEKVEITNMVVISEDVTGVYGKVDVDGSVYVKGSVHSGGYIKATGDIIVENNVEAGKLVAGRNILIKRGSCSKSECYLEADGEVSGSFFEAAHIKAEGNVNANYIMNSEIETFGKVIVSGSRGMLLGGTISALRGIETYNLGNSTNIQTVLDVGKNEIFTKRITDLGNQKEKISEEVKVFEEGLRRMAGGRGTSIESRDALRRKLSAGIRMKIEEFHEIEKEEERLIKVAEQECKNPVCVKGRAYAGAVVIIDKCKYDLKMDVRRVIFRRKKSNVVMVQM